LPTTLIIGEKIMPRDHVLPIEIDDVFKVAKSGNTRYIDITRIAKLFRLESGDKLRVEIKEKILETY